MADAQEIERIVKDAMTANLTKMTAADGTLHKKAEELVAKVPTYVDIAASKGVSASTGDYGKKITAIVDLFIEIEDSLHDERMELLDKDLQRDRMDRLGLQDHSALIYDEAEIALLKEKLEQVGTAYAERRAASKDKLRKLLRDGRRKIKQAQCQASLS